MACLTEGLPLGVPCGVPCLVLCPLGPGSTFLSSALCATQLSGAHLFEIPHGGLTYTIAACCRLLSCSTHVFKEIGVTSSRSSPRVQGWLSRWLLLHDQFKPACWFYGCCTLQQLRKLATGVQLGWGSCRNPRVSMSWWCRGCLTTGIPWMGETVEPAVERPAMTTRPVTTAWSQAFHLSTCAKMNA